MVEMIMNKKLDDIVEKTSLAEWKYILYIISIHADVAMRPTLIVRLADRLYKANDKHAALMCYIASGNVEKLVEKGMDQRAKDPNRKTRYQIRQEEKRKNKELEQKRFMMGMLLMVGLIVVILVVCAVGAKVFPG